MVIIDNGVQVSVMRVGTFYVNCKGFCVGERKSGFFPPLPVSYILCLRVMNLSLDARKAFIIMNIRMFGMLSLDFLYLLSP